MFSTRVGPFSYLFTGFMLGVFNSTVTTKFVQLHYFLSQIIGRTKDIVSPLVQTSATSPWNSVSCAFLLHGQCWSRSGHKLEVFWNHWIWFKNCPLLESSSPPWCPKLVTGREVQQMFSFPSSLLRHYQMPECFYVNYCCFWAHATVLSCYRNC